MCSAVCWKCFEDVYLSARAKREGERLKCSVCHKIRKGFTVERLGEVLDPVLREHIREGREIPTPGQGDDDRTYWVRQGDPLSHWVQVILDQSFGFNDEIVDAVVAAEDVDERDGDIAFFDSTADYESTPISLHEYQAEWEFVLEELKHSRRFFSSSAQALFGRLFHDIETMKSYNDDSSDEENVVWNLPVGSKLYRARTCDSLTKLKDFYAEPLKHVGPPPSSQARAGRMNVEGVVVFYGAIEPKTCLAEMRPALGGDTALIELQTSKSLRMLDFTRLQKSHGEGLSYFQSNFTEEVERRAFLRRLHSLISQPVIPGKESDYLITQTLSEYLAHVHEEPFDGILFKSVQRAGGTNIVLFPERRTVASPGENMFPLSYVDESFKLFSTKKIRYTHEERHLFEYKGKVTLAHEDDSGLWLE
jgi:hypothetical protein